MNSANWMTDLRVEHLFQEFPLALAVLSPDGKLEGANRKFAELYEPTCLGSPALQGMVREAGPEWHPVSLVHRDGAKVTAQAQCLRIEDRVMLVVDETPNIGAGELELLHKRVVELEVESSTDPLTGAWNRLHLGRVLAAEMDRSVRFKEPLSIVLIDIDLFKRVNDVHGHLAGDAVLKQLVSLVRAKSRAADLLVRWGGEEFVLLVSAGYRAADGIAEGLRRAVEKDVFPAVGAITISAGVAELLPSEGSEAWFSRADAMLYAAKNGGRNRVSVDRRGSSDVWAAEHGRSALHLAWLEAYESGEATIDSQHRELFDLANTLIDVSVDPHLSSASQLAAMDRLLAHVVKHFADEEVLLEQRGYVRLAMHKNAHASLVRRALRLRDEMAVGTARLGPIVEFLAGQVVAKHMLTMDRDFFPLFQA